MIKQNWKNGDEDSAIKKATAWKLRKETMIKGPGKIDDEEMVRKKWRRDGDGEMETKELRK